MQRFSQKYTIIQLLEDLPEGYEYDWKDWPLHVTIADVFAIDWPIDILQSKLEEFTQHQPSFNTTALNDELFGPDRDIRVVLIDKTSELSGLHTRIVKLLEEGNVRFNNPQYTLEGFLPHSTVQRRRRLRQGDSIAFTSISIIDMFPSEDPYRRKVLKTIPFKGLETQIRYN